MLLTVYVGSARDLISQKTEQTYNKLQGLIWLRKKVGVSQSQPFYVVRSALAVCCMLLKVNLRSGALSFGARMRESRRDREESWDFLFSLSLPDRRLTKSLQYKIDQGLTHSPPTRAVTVQVKSDTLNRTPSLLTRSFPPEGCHSFYETLYTKPNPFSFDSIPFPGVVTVNMNPDSLTTTTTTTSNFICMIA